MANNKVQIQITAQDLASSIISTINKEMSKTGDVAQQVTASMKSAGETGTRSFGEMLTPLRQIPLAFNQTLSMVNTLAAGLMSLMGPAMQMDVINIQFKTVAGNAALAAKDLEYIRLTSDKLGLSFQETASSFGMFAGATKNTSLEGGKAKDLFEGLAMSITAMHLPAETAQRVMVQLSQAIGKNKMTMVDWRPILEAFPMLNERFAASLGVTTAQMAQMMEAGQLTNKEIAKLGPILKQTFEGDALHAAHSMQGELNRLKTASFEAAVGLAEMVKPAVTDGIRLAADSMGLITTAGKGLIAIGIPAVIGKIAAAAIEMLAADAAAVTASRSLAAQKAAEMAATLAASNAKVAELKTKMSALIAERQSLLMAQANTAATILSEDADIQAAATKQRLTAIQIEFTGATRAATLANVQYAAAARATTVTGQAAAGAATGLSSVMAMMGGPIGVGVAAFAGFVMVLDAVGDAVVGNTKDFDENSRKIAENAEKARQAAADRKAIADAYFSAVGEDLDKQLEKVKKTYDAETQAINDEMNARRKEAGNNSALLLKIDEDEKTARRKVYDRFLAGTAAARDDETKNLEKGYAESLKVAEAYYKATGDQVMVNYTKNKKILADEIKAINAHYSEIETEARNNGTTLVGIATTRQNAIEAAEKRHSERLKIQQMADAIDARKGIVDAEIAAINLAAAKKEITAQESERRVTLLTVAAAQDQYQARKNVADKALEIYGRDSEEYKARLKEMETAHTAYTQANLAAYKKYADEIKRIDQDIKDFRQSIQDKIKDIQQKGMTDAQKYADDQKRFDEAVSKSREALAVKDYDTAQKYARQAEDLASRLVDKKAESNTKLQTLELQHQQKLADIARQATGAQTDQQRQASEMSKENADYEKQRLALLAEQKATTEGITNATRALNTVEQLGVDILQAKKQENVDALSRLKEIQDFKLDPKNIPVNLDEGALGAAKSLIASLTKDETKTIYVKTVNTGGGAGTISDAVIPGFFDGGKITGGSPLRDSVPLWGAQNEWMINNRATGFWGDRIMGAINEPFSASGQRLQMLINGAGATQPPVPNMGSINLNIGGGSFPVSAPADVMAQLMTAARRERLRRPQ